MRGWTEDGGSVRVADMEYGTESGLESLFRYFSILVVAGGGVALAAFLLLLLGVWSNRQITKERFLQTVAFLAVLMVIFLLMIYLYFL
ncbi:MAG: hypothetical protein HQ523_00660 [Lentisphaerae bacterium]|nr:hypothetical protein [Lentisphaerota bacterium]